MRLMTPVYYFITNSYLRRYFLYKYKSIYLVYGYIEPFGTARQRLLLAAGASCKGN